MNEHMSDRLQKLEKAVKALYDNPGPNVGPWINWIYKDHVLVVADNATLLAHKYGADAELARVGGLLHDIADTKMTREDGSHEEESLHMARDLMQAAGYSQSDVKLVVDDAIRNHSCHGSNRPKSLEGKVLATADA